MDAKWVVFVDHDGERANTVFDESAQAYDFAELLEEQSSFDSVYVRRCVKVGDAWEVANQM